MPKKTSKPVKTRKAYAAPPILALDIATQLGYATNCGHEACSRLSGTHRLPITPDMTLGAKLQAFEDWLLEEFTNMHRLPHHIAYEVPALRGRAAYLLNGFCSVLHLACHRYGIEVVQLHTSTIKKHATGSGRATKLEMVEAAKNNPAWKHLKIEDDNHADALWLLDLAETSYDPLTKTFNKALNY